MLKKQLIAVTCLVIVLLSNPWFSIEGAELAEVQIYKVGLRVGDITTLDPHFASTHGDRPIIKAIYNSLVDFPPNSIALEDIEPVLAKDWSVSDDGKVWTFYLREGIQFHRGYGELTSEDVVFSLNRARDPEMGSPFRNSFALVESVRAVDRYTVEITLSNADPFMLYRLIGYQVGFILSKKAVEELGSAHDLNPVGTGPFMFERHYPREKVTLVANKEYFRGAPILDGAEVLFMVDDSSRELAIRAGEVHAVCGGSDSSWLKRMEKVDNVTLDLTGGGWAGVIHFNMDIAPFDSLKVRQALAHATDRQILVEFLGDFISSVLDSPVPKGYFGHTTDGIPSYEYDLGKAKALLAEAGYPEGFSFSIDMSDGFPYLRHTEILQEMWRQAGIDMTVRVVDHPSYHEIIRSNKNPIVYYSAFRLPIADIYLREFYHSDSVIGKPTAITNFSHFGELTPGIDSLIEEASIEMDSERQLALYHEAQKQIMEILPAFPLVHAFDLIARHSTLDLGYEIVDSMPNLTAQYEINEKMRILK